MFQIIAVHKHIIGFYLQHMFIYLPVQSLLRM